MMKPIRSALARSRHFLRDIANTRAGAHTIDIVALRNTRRSRLRVANPKAPSSDPHCG
jgi:hypothetical protein